MLIRDLLKKKGIGPTMSKHLDEKECEAFLAYIRQESSSIQQAPVGSFQHSSVDSVQQGVVNSVQSDLVSLEPVNPVTLATLCVAFEMLPRTDIEANIYDSFKLLLAKHQPVIFNALYGGEMVVAEGHVHVGEDSKLAAAVRHVVKHESFSSEQLTDVLPCLFGAGHSDLTTGSGQLEPSGEVELMAPSRETDEFKSSRIEANQHKAMLLEGLRIKRETVAENVASLQFLCNLSTRTQVDVSVLVDIANPYDGFTREFPCTLFLPIVLAELGIPAVCQGVDSIGPKYGVTMHQVLKYEEKQPLITLEQAKAQLENPAIGWAYIDQAIYSPDLYGLKSLRHDMMKRPMLATHEKCLTPLVGDKTMMVVGYTHPPYKKMMAHVLKEHPFVEKSLILRGQEGSVQLGLDRKAPYVVVNRNFDFDESAPSQFVQPVDYGLIEPDNERLGMEMPEEAIQMERPEEAIQHVIQAVMDAFGGAKNTARAQLTYLACVVVEKLELMSRQEALDAINKAFESGRLQKRWELGQEGL